jgi:acyl carrier protein phosphodiesterase
MNHLSHAVLSFPNKKMMVGQFLGDGVRGKDFNYFEPEIRAGILLHRWIDSNLDSFQFIQQIRAEIRSEVGLYSPVFIDILLDHFRAKHFDTLGMGKLKKFQDDWISMLLPFENQMSRRLLGYYQAMLKYQWFQTYESIEGTQEVLIQMAMRLPKSDGLRVASIKMPEFVTQFENDYLQFWSEFQSVFYKIQSEHMKDLPK